MRRCLPPLLRVCIAPVDDAHADGGADAPPNSPGRGSRRWPQLVSPRQQRTEERTPLAGAEVELEESRPDEEKDDDDDDDQGQTRFRGRDREARAAHDEAVQQVACVLPFEEEAEVRAVREEEASFLAALGLTEGEEGEESEDGEDDEEALEAEQEAIFAQLLHGSSDGSRDAPPPRSQKAGQFASYAAAIDVPVGMPTPSCPLLLRSSSAQRQRRQLQAEAEEAEEAEETEEDSDASHEEGAAAVAVADDRSRTTVSHRGARTGRGTEKEKASSTSLVQGKKYWNSG